MASPVELARGAAVCVGAGVLVLMAGTFVALPIPAAAAALACALAGNAWLAFAQRSWKLAVLATWVAVSNAAPIFQHRPPAPGGSGALLALIAYAALVLGSAWLGRHDGQAGRETGVSQPPQD